VEDIKRNYIPPIDFLISDIHTPCLDTTCWNPPPYKERYRNDRFVWNKPICVISNKYSTEWGKSPVNYLSLEVLEEIFYLLKDKYQIIYNRPGGKDIPADHQNIVPLGDYELIGDKFSDIVTTQQLFNDNKDLTFNTLQLMLFANCNRFISVQGGGCILASYFGGMNIIYAKAGRELAAGTYKNWYNKLSGCEVYHTDNYKDLIFTIKNKFNVPT
jgi:hypothetical protein